MQPARQGSMGRASSTAPGYPSGVAICARMSLCGFKLFASFTANCGIHLAAALRHSWLGMAGRPTMRRYGSRTLNKYFQKRYRTCRSHCPSFDVRVAVSFTRSKLCSRGDITMRFMVIVKANKDSEAGVMPKQQLLAEMGKFNEELVKAGVLLAADGLQPSSKGKRVRFSGEKRTVIDGPFSETKELIAGFWLWQVRSMEEAVEWVKRCPSPHQGESEIEIRQVFEAEDFGSEFTPELRKQEEQLRAQAAAKKP